MELKSKSNQNRVPKQSLREDMSTERQAKNKKKQKARTETVKLFNFKLSKVRLSLFLLFVCSCSLLVFLLTYLLLGFVLGLSFDYFLIWVLASFLACLLFRCDGEGQNIGCKSTSIGQFFIFKSVSSKTRQI